MVARFGLMPALARVENWMHEIVVWGRPLEQHRNPGERRSPYISKRAVSLGFGVRGRVPAAQNHTLYGRNTAKHLSELNR